MSKEHSRYRWFVVGVFFFFMFLHQTDKLMIGSLQVQITDDFGINAIHNGGWSIRERSLWQRFYIRYGDIYMTVTRASNCSALASFIWGATTWLNAIVRSTRVFLDHACLDRHR
jgi:MFS transporter, Spinster family, sphingosine-1-phosphate transporter